MRPGKRFSCCPSPPCLASPTDESRVGHLSRVQAPVLPWQGAHARAPEGRARALPLPPRWFFSDPKILACATMMPAPRVKMKPTTTSKVDALPGASTSRARTVAMPNRMPCGVRLSHQQEKEDSFPAPLTKSGHLPQPHQPPAPGGHRIRKPGHLCPKPTLSFFGRRSRLHWAKRSSWHVSTSRNVLKVTKPVSFLRYKSATRPPARLHEAGAGTATNEEHSVRLVSWQVSRQGQSDRRQQR